MQFSIYKVCGEGNSAVNFEVHPTLKEARKAVLRDMRKSAKFVKDNFGCTDVILDRKNYTMQFRTPLGGWGTWFWGAETVD